MRWWKGGGRGGHTNADALSLQDVPKASPDPGPAPAVAGLLLNLDLAPALAVASPPLDLDHVPVTAAAALATAAAAASPEAAASPAAAVATAARAVLTPAHVPVLASGAAARAVLAPAHVLAPVLVGVADEFAFRLIKKLGFTKRAYSWGCRWVKRKKEVRSPLPSRLVETTSRGPGPPTWLC